jgi:hypothetical protein
MRSKLWTFLTLLLLAVVLVACGGGDVVTVEPWSLVLLQRTGWQETPAKRGHST